MAADSYSFLDIAALPAVRGPLRRGDALLMLSTGLDEVLWANGPGAFLLGFPGIDELLGAPAPLSGTARRQIAATSGFPAIGANRSVSVRLQGAGGSRAVPFRASAVPLPDGAAGILLALPHNGAGAAERALAGIAQPGQAAAIVATDGAVVAASPDFAGLGLSPELLRRLVARAGEAPGQPLKQKVQAGGRALPAGVAVLEDGASLVIVTEDDFLELPDDVLSADDAEQAEADLDAAGLGDASLDPDSLGPDDGPGVEILLDDADDWYFDDAGEPEGATAEARLAAVQAGPPVRFSWRTDPEGRFVSVSPEFTAFAGLGADALAGQDFAEVARRFGIAGGGEVAALLQGRDTWSGRTVLWPVADGSIQVPVDLAALPTYSRARSFDGFRGFGVARTADAAALGDAGPGGAVDAPPPSGAAGPPDAAPAPSLKDDSDRVVRLLAPASAAEGALSPGERDAFLEIGARLKGEGSEDGAVSDETVSGTGNETRSALSGEPARTDTNEPLPVAPVDGLSVDAGTPEAEGWVPARSGEGPAAVAVNADGDLNDAPSLAAFDADGDSARDNAGASQWAGDAAGDEGSSTGPEESYQPLHIGEVEAARVEADAADVPDEAVSPGSAGAEGGPGDGGAAFLPDGTDTGAAGIARDDAAPSDAPPEPSGGLEDEGAPDAFPIRLTPGEEPGAAEPGPAITRTEQEAGPPSVPQEAGGGSADGGASVQSAKEAGSSEAEAPTRDAADASAGSPIASMVSVETDSSASSGVSDQSVEDGGRDAVDADLAQAGSAGDPPFEGEERADVVLPRAQEEVELDPEAVGDIGDDADGARAESPRAEHAIVAGDDLAKAEEPALDRSDDAAAAADAEGGAPPQGSVVEIEGERLTLSSADEQPGKAGSEVPVSGMEAGITVSSTEPPAQEADPVASLASDEPVFPGEASERDDGAARFHEADAQEIGDGYEAPRQDAVDATAETAGDGIPAATGMEAGAAALLGPGAEDDEPPKPQADAAPVEDAEATMSDVAGLSGFAVADAQPATSADEQGRFDEDVSRAPRPDTPILDRLPVPVLIHSGDLLHYANPEFLALADYPSLGAFGEAGGLGCLFTAPWEQFGEGGDRRLRLRTGGGEEFPVEALLRTVPWGGAKALLLVLRRLDGTQGRDTAETAALGQRLTEMRAIIDTATDGVVLITPDGAIRSLSRPAEALFGIDSDAAAGLPFGSLFAAESQRMVADYLHGLAGDGVASVLNDGREVIGREAKGGFIPLFMSIGSLPEGSGFCAVLRDITQWKRAEEELVQSRALAERASSHKTDFLARVSHEIRTPLNAIIGFSELMLDEKFGPVGSDRYRDYLRDINRSGSHVLDLVNDLLDISKIEAGQQEMSYEAVALNDALGEAVATMQPQANRERVIIRSSFASRLPDVVADPRSVRQIALNVLSNAIRFTQAGGQVIVSTAYSSSGDVVMRVRDTGIGMSQAEIEQALKPFKQINSLKRSRGDGTGLGLPLTKAMVEANRARFAISSDPGVGTMVEVTFPATRVLAG